MRVPESVKTIFGPYICGHSLDVRGNTVLAGTCTSEGMPFTGFQIGLLQLFCDAVAPGLAVLLLIIAHACVGLSIPAVQAS